MRWVAEVLSPVDAESADWPMAFRLADTLCITIEWLVGSVHRKYEVRQRQAPRG